MPRSPNSQVNWCVASGECEKKSQMLSGSWRLVKGSYFWEWMKSGNLMPSRDEEDGRVVADQVPVAVLRVDFQGESARSRAVSAAPREPATVEKRMNTGVRL